MLNSTKLTSMATPINRFLKIFNCFPCAVRSSRVSGLMPTERPARGALTPRMGCLLHWAKKARVRGENRTSDPRDTVRQFFRQSEAAPDASPD
jgi:hypothetical protein